MNRNRLANGSEIEASENRPIDMATPLAEPADPQVEAECAALFRPTLAVAFGACALPLWQMVAAIVLAV